VGAVYVGGDGGGVLNVYACMRMWLCACVRGLEWVRAWELESMHMCACMCLVVGVAVRLSVCVLFWQR